MQLKALRITAMTLAGAVLLAAALPGPHGVAQAAEDTSAGEALLAKCGLIDSLLHSTRQNIFPANFLMGQRFEDRVCLPQFAENAFNSYERAVNDAGAGASNGEAAQVAFKRHALDLVRTSADMRKLMLEIAAERHEGILLEEFKAQIAWIEEIENGDPRALYETALRVRDGDGLPKHRVASLTWLQRAGDHGVTEALYAAARMMLDEPGRGSSDAVGEILLKQAARAGHPVAQREFGLGIFARSQDEHDRYKAYSWLLLAEANGADVEDGALAEAMATLSEETLQRVRMRVQKATGKARLPTIWPLSDDVSANKEWRENLRVALRWGECASALSVIEGAREAGDAGARHGLAVLYEEGACVEQDFGRALEHYRQAADEGHRDSAFPLGILYYDGRGAPRDLVVARHWFKAAALGLVGGSERRSTRLISAGIHLRRLGKEELPPELIAEIDWLTEIEDGDPRILHETALRVRDGDGLPRDRLAAESWLAAAGKRGVPEAYYDLGLTRLNDPVRPRDDEFGISALARAGRDGFVPAQVELGRRYAAGIQVQQWDHAAYVWLSMAKENGADVSALLEKVGERLTERGRQAAREEAEKGTYYPLDLR